MSYSTFLTVLCSTFSSSLEGASSLTLKSSPTWNRRQNLRKNLYTPSIPCVSQGLLNSKGPRNISYRRNVSAPYSSIIVSGFTTLNMDFDIFSMAHPQMYFPFSRINSALAYSGIHARNAFKSRTSFLTIFTSTWISVVLY